MAVSEVAEGTVASMFVSGFLEKEDTFQTSGSV